jgi:hypothetical protein
MGSKSFIPSSSKISYRELKRKILDRIVAAADGGNDIFFATQHVRHARGAAPLQVMSWRLSLPGVTDSLDGRNSNPTRLALVATFS